MIHRAGSLRTPTPGIIPEDAAEQQDVQLLLPQLNRADNAAIDKRTTSSWVSRIIYIYWFGVVLAGCLVVAAVIHWGPGLCKLQAAQVAAPVQQAPAASRTSITTTTAAAGPPAGSVSRAARCSWGTSPGTWVLGQPAGSSWQLLDPSCQLRNLLQAYRAAAAAAADEGDSISTTSSSTPADGDGGASGHSRNSSGSNHNSSSGGHQDVDAAAGETPPATQYSQQLLSSSSSSNSNSSKTTASNSKSSLSSKSNVDGTSNNSSSSRSNVSSLEPDLASSSSSAVAAAGAGQEPSVPTSSPGGQGGGAPPLRVLMLSDSVDRYILQYVCGAVGGIKETTLPGDSGSGSTTTADDSSGVGVGGRRLAGVAAAAASATAQGDDDASWEGDITSNTSNTQQPLQQRSMLAADAATPQPTPLSRTAYAFHSCATRAPLKLASAYFPGVHPAGPFHRAVQQDGRQRLAATAALWEVFSPGAPPQVVVLSACLWDLARLARHEPQAVSQPQLSPQLLADWAANFTALAQHARQVFPQTHVWLTHTTLLPKHHPDTGIMFKPYLGRAYYIHQLNAALRAAAAGGAALGLVDYVPLGQAWEAGQQHLVDAIHPSLEVGLEAGNLLLNVALQRLEALQQSSGQHAQQQEPDGR